MQSNRPLKIQLFYKRVLQTVLVTVLLATFFLPLPAQVKRVLPKEFKKLEFGMSMEQFATKRRTADPNHLTKEKFRYAWVETFPSDHSLQSVKFYFSDKEDRPLYEVILYYQDLRARDTWIDKYFGAPNFKNNTEWQLVTKKGQQFRAWRYEERLIITALLPGTEWEERK